MPSTVSITGMLLAPLLHGRDERGEARRTLPPSRVVQERADPRSATEAAISRLAARRKTHALVVDHALSATCGPGIKLALRHA